MALKVGELYTTIGLDKANYTGGLKALESATAATGQRIQAVLGSVIRKFELVAAAAAAAAVAAGVAGVKLAADWEQAEVAFTTMLGSAEKARAFMAELESFAARTPFELPGLITASRQMMAYGFAAKDVLPMMTQIGDAVSGLGGGAVEIERVVRAFGQIKAKGKVSAEEFMQLAELGIPAWQMLADAIGTSIPDAMKQSEQGAISATVGINAVLDGMTKRFGGQMEKASQTVQGLWSTMRDNVNTALRDIGKTIIETFDLRGLMRRVSEWLEKNKERFRTWAGHIVGAIKDVMKGATDLAHAFLGVEPSADAMADAMTGLFVVLRKISTWFRENATAIGEKMRAWLPILAAVAAAWLAVAMAQRIAAAFTAILTAMTALATKNVKVIITAVLALVAAVAMFKYSKDAIKEVQQALADLKTTTAGMGTDLAGDLGEALLDVPELARDMAQEVGGAIEGIAGTVAASTETIWDKLADKMRSTLDETLSRFRDWGRAWRDQMSSDADEVIRVWRDKVSAAQDEKRGRYAKLGELGAGGVAAMRNVRMFAGGAPELGMENMGELSGIFREIMSQRAREASLKSATLSTLFGDAFPIATRISSMRNAPEGQTYEQNVSLITGKLDEIRRLNEGMLTALKNLKPQITVTS